MFIVRTTARAPNLEGEMKQMKKSKGGYGGKSMKAGSKRTKGSSGARSQKKMKRRTK